jgi:hypothetical protein
MALITLRRQTVTDARLTELFSPFEIAHLVELYDQPNFHDAAVAYITPLIPRINRRVGHENDAGYIAYAVEHVFSQVLLSKHNPAEQNISKISPESDTHDDD